MTKIKTQFQIDCDNYMKGEIEYLGIRKDKTTGYITSVPKKQTFLQKLLKKLNPSKYV